MPRSSPRRHSSSLRIVGRDHSVPASHGHTTASAAHAPARSGARSADVRLASGIRLRYLEQGDRAGRAVIMLHGLADSSFSFSRILPHLSEVHRLLVPDLRGHGESDRPPEGYGPRDMAEDVLGLMDALGIERATLVGHSMGTFVVQQAALAAPQRVAGLVLIGSATTALNEVLLELQGSLADLPDPVPEEFVREFQVGTTHQPTPEGFMARVVAESRKAPARVWRAALAGLLGEERFTGLGEARIPALLLWGERDGIFPLSEQEALFETLPVASLKVYRETGHSPHWERPREVVRDLERFLRTTLA
jgi:non-heme chloroperoxidase